MYGDDASFIGLDMTTSNFKAQLTELKAQSVGLAMRIYELEAMMNWSKNDCSGNNYGMPIQADQGRVTLSDQEQPHQTHALSTDVEDPVDFI